MNKNKNKFALSVAIILGSIIITGCSSTNFDDLSVWMKDQNTKVKGKIDSLPPAKTFIPRNFIAKQNPFEEKESLSLSKLDDNKYAPDPNRRKEPLEGYALEAIKMVGFLSSSIGPQAIINTADKKVHFVAINNYLGKNYGKITKISEGQLILEERIVGGDGAWILKEAIVYLDDGSKKK